MLDNLRNYIYLYLLGEIIISRKHKLKIFQITYNLKQSGNVELFNQ